MARAHDGEETGHGGRNIHRPKRAREELSWSPEASQELLRLRFRTLRTRFDDAETVADVHEAWGVVAARLNDMEGMELDLDAVKCSDQLTRLRQQWQESNTAQLHVMMAECFNKRPIQPLQDGRNANIAMEETTVQEASAKGSPKRKKTAVAEGTPSVTEAEAPLSPEPAPVSHHAVSPIPQEDDQYEVPISPEPAPASPQQEMPSARQVDVQAVEVEEFPRQDEIMRALEKRSRQFERLAQSRQQLADVTQKLMEALLNRQGRM
ncbi:hypothetical protein PC128_g10840 [Phytophthora cactorum]|nr:hypothetical protein PC120_g19021 [Phytophthora cactorum]KAG3069464.1 hypothetical protein PC121_g9805 [Phytophthora cactorum]KAG3191644.1 hypothetical protein PC128_g10840 [Phytophthora cactorum]KAG4045335.1 hypothetical protein PC123_g19256 [Phytophthora cactorum]